MKENILLITDVLPCKNYSGGILSLQLSKFLLEEKHNLFCICIKDVGINEDVDQEVIQKIKILSFDKPNENDRSNQFDKKINEIIKKSIKFIEKNNITKIWCPVQGETLTLVLKSITEKCSTPYVVQIWDPIEWFLKEKKYSNKKTDQIVKLFENLLVKASYCLTASSSMTEKYKKKYNKNSIEIYTSIKEPNIKIDKNKKKNEFIIVFSGQTYAKDEIEIFLNTLISMKWKYKGKNIIFKYFGNSGSNVFLKKEYKVKNIQLLGFVSQEELMEESSKADLLYCPYFFSNEKVYKKVVQESFPSKIVTYLPTKVPILIHAPEYSSVSLFFKNKDAAYILNSINNKDVSEMIRKTIDDSFSNDKINNISNNAIKLYNEHFVPSVVKKNFFKGLELKYDGKNKMKVLQVNNVDLPGRRFNGFDILKYINNNSDHLCNQIVTYKTSNCDNVYTFFNNYEQMFEYKMLSFEAEEMSVHSNLSLTSPALKIHDLFNNSDIVHYHLIHNTKLSLYSLIELCNKKKTILSIHDPWTITGRCVHYEECNQWMTGCHNCPKLETLFPLKEDNCNELWNLKKLVYNNIDVDIIVSSKYMLNLIKKSPLTKHFKNIHLIPFGINLDLFNEKIPQNNAKKKFGINKDDFVLFFRAQEAFKGTEYIVEALKDFTIQKNITIITCSEKGILGDLYDKYNIIELGHVDTEDLIYAYRACDIFLMPSIGESFGMMAIEAMACGKPIIVFDNTALPSVTFAPECGVLVENKNSLKLKEAIEWLINDDNERIRRGKLAREIAEKYYDENVYNESILNLYTEIYNRERNTVKLPQVITEPIDFNSEQTKLISHKLNLFTETLFDDNSGEYKKLYIKINGKFNKSKKISYYDVNVQKTISMYNDNLYSLINSNVNLDVILKKRGIKPIKWLKRFLYLIKNDRDTLKQIVKYELRNHPKILKIIKTIYKIKKNK